jgi:hypothetical protein
MRKDKRKLDYAARRQFEKDWGSRRNLWDADHIVPVVEGGGECDLSNMRTLSLKCQRDVTAELRRRRRPGPSDAVVIERSSAPPPHDARNPPVRRSGRAGLDR